MYPNGFGNSSERLTIIADLSITAANVLPGAGAQISAFTAGANITAGQVVYYDSAAGTVKLADADASATAGAFGIALNGASAGQPVDVITGGYLTINAVGAKGVTYYASTTAGGLCPFADLTTGDFATVVAVGVSTTSLFVHPFATGVEL